MSGGSVGRVGRRLAVAAAAVVVGFGVSGALQPANAISTGEAVGIGVGAAVLGTALGASVANPNYYPGGYNYPPGYYYGPAQPVYPNYPTGSCWSPYYQRYVPC
jgi:hypothetical protein